MHHLVPDFILHHDAAGECKGQMDAAVLFVDIAGFSAVTDALMKHGTHGAEVLAMLMRRVFAPLVRRVYEQGGFVAHFAGDAFTALFPEDVGRFADGDPSTSLHAGTLSRRDSPIHALAVGWAMQADLAALPPQQTRYGEFSLAVKIGLDFGAVQWGIVRSEDNRRASYYFAGSPMDGAVQAEHAAQEGGTLNNLGAVLMDQGDFASAQAYLARARAVCREVGDREGETLALYNLGYAAWFQGDYAGAGRHYQQSLDGFLELGDRQMEAYALHKLGDVALVQGSFDQALVRYEQSLAQCQAMGCRDGAGQALTGLGDALTMPGALLEAEAFLLEAIAVRRALGQQPRLMETLAALARVHLAQGAAPQALAVVEEILAFLDAGGHFNGTEYRLRNDLTCYQVLQATGDPRAARVLQTAYAQLQAEAARIPDQAARRSFLENVTWHQEIAAAIVDRLAAGLRSVADLAGA